MDKVKTIVAIDDNPDELLLLRHAFLMTRIPHRFISLRSGESAMAYFATAASTTVSSQFPVPDLVLVDLRMPSMDGFDVLLWIRSQPSFAALPVILLTVATDELERLRSRLLGATGYRIKPLGLEDGVRMVEEMMAGLVAASATKHRDSLPATGPAWRSGERSRTVFPCR